MLATPTAPLAPAQVLIVDPSAENREVLRTALARLGARSVEAEHAHEGAALVASSRPALIVCDAECDASREGDSLAELSAVAARTDTPIVLIGGSRREFPSPGAIQRVAKPYHFGPLVHRIADVLAARRAA